MCQPYPSPFRVTCLARQSFFEVANGHYYHPVFQQNTFWFQCSECVMLLLSLKGRAVSFREDHLIFVSHWDRLDGRQDSLITSDFCQLNEACRKRFSWEMTVMTKGRVIHSKHVKQIQKPTKILTTNQDMVSKVTLFLSKGQKLCIPWRIQDNT